MKMNTEEHILHLLEQLKLKDTLIESQKEEIERLKKESPNYHALESRSRYKDAMELAEENFAEAKVHIESLKAIKELAVKGLKEIACLNVDSAYSAGTIARNTFSEIEVLQNAHIQPKSPS